MEITVYAQQIGDFGSRDMTEAVAGCADDHFETDQPFDVVSITWEGPQDGRGRWVVVLEDNDQLSPDGWDRTWDLSSKGQWTVRDMKPRFDPTPGLTSVTIDVVTFAGSPGREAADATLQALAVASQAGFVPVAPEGFTTPVVADELVVRAVGGSRHLVTVWAFVDTAAHHRHQSAQIVRSMIASELTRISDGQGVDEDGVPFGAGNPTHQITAYGVPRHLNFALIPCWSDAHATLEYALAQIEYPGWSVSLVRHEWDRPDREVGKPHAQEILHAYRIAAGDQADGECDCGKGDWCPQYGRETKPTAPARQPWSTNFQPCPCGGSHDAETHRRVQPETYPVS